MTLSASPSPVMLDADAVRRLLPMSDCIEAMDRAMRTTSRGEVALPPRQFSDLVDGSGSLGVMPGSLLKPPVYGTKVTSIHPRNPEHGRPAIQGLMLLFDHASGCPIAVMDGAVITGIRTAAASGLATRELARKNSKRLGILGYGVQAATHLDAVLTVREIEEALVWGRDHAKAKAFAEAHGKRTGVNTKAAAAEDVCACDIVCAATSATEPVLRGEWLTPGAHVNLVGTHTPRAREADAAALAQSSVYIDLIESARNEAGDILMAVEEGAMLFSDVVGEIGQVLENERPGRISDDQITLYKSVGIVTQDLFAADVVYRNSLRETDGEQGAD